MGSGVRDLEHRNGAPRSKPRRRFGDFAAAGKVTRRPQAAKSPCERRNGRMKPRSETKFRTKFFCLLFFQEK